MSKSNLTKWLDAQSRELLCWLDVKNKILTPDYLNAKKRYWHKIILKIEKYLEKSKSFLDIGCGPAGIFIALSNKNSRKVGIDPLMDHYLKELPYLSQLGVKWINGSIEDKYFTEKFDTIFIFNALDHTKDPELVVKK